MFNSLGFEFYQSGGNVKGAVYLHKVGREYKKPGTNEVWSYSDSDLDDEFYNDRGTFFHSTDFNRDEIDKQKQGFILNRIYFNYGTSTSGSTGTGSQPYTEVQIYNLKLGWGSGEASNNHRICLPKSDHSIQAAQLHRLAMTLFPARKEDFTAENGVTYTWEDNRWRTKAYKLDESKLDVPLKGATDRCAAGPRTASAARPVRLLGKSGLNDKPVCPCDR